MTINASRAHNIEIQEAYEHINLTLFTHNCGTWEFYTTAVLALSLLKHSHTVTPQVAVKKVVQT